MQMWILHDFAALLGRGCKEISVFKGEALKQWTLSKMLIFGAMFQYWVFVRGTPPPQEENKHELINNIQSENKIK